MERCSNDLFAAKDAVVAATAGFQNCGIRKAFSQCLAKRKWDLTIKFIISNSKPNGKAQVCSGRAQCRRASDVE